MENENKYRNQNGLKEHRFNVADAVQFGMEAAAIIYNLRFWLDKERYRSVHEYDGKEYYWIGLSHEEFSGRIPYITKRKIGKILRRLEKSGTIISENFKQDFGFRYKVKHYTIPNLYLIN